MQTDLSTTELSGWISNFNNNGNLPFITTSALISLQELEDFITKIKGQQADSIRIYFLRFGLNSTPKNLAPSNGASPDGCKFHWASGDLSQASIAMVPATNFRIDENFIFCADDIIAGNAITTLMPGIEEKGTGLNPPSPPKATKMVQP
ncbi:hypothetical protein ACX0G9_15385 [Flavitalea flava]